MNFNKGGDSQKKKKKGTPFEKNKYLRNHDSVAPIFDISM
jgi:hypothetical protein